MTITACERKKILCARLGSEYARSIQPPAAVKVNKGVDNLAQKLVRKEQLSKEL